MKTFFFDSIHNTQEYALSIINEESVLVVSYSQEVGKGTSNKVWKNADQSLACSLAIREQDIKLLPTLISLASSYDFLKTIKNPHVYLKWPNDIMKNQKKVGGVLVEKVGENICIGMGINYFWKDPEILNAGALYDKLQNFDLINQHAISWATNFEKTLTQGRFSLDEYKENLKTLGKVVEYPEGRGWAMNVNSDGSLLVKTIEGTLINLTSPLISEVN